MLMNDGPSEDGASVENPESESVVAGDSVDPENDGVDPVEAPSLDGVVDSGSDDSVPVVSDGFDTSGTGSGVVTSSTSGSSVGFSGSSDTGVDGVLGGCSAVSPETTTSGTSVRGASVPGDEVETDTTGTSVSASASSVTIVAGDEVDTISGTSVSLSGWAVLETKSAGDSDGGIPAPSPPGTAVETDGAVKISGSSVVSASGASGGTIGLTETTGPSPPSGVEVTSLSGSLSSVWDVLGEEVDTTAGASVSFSSGLAVLDTRSAGDWDGSTGLLVTISMSVSGVVLNSTSSGLLVDDEVEDPDSTLLATVVMSWLSTNSLSVEGGTGVPHS